MSKFMSKVSRVVGVRSPLIDGVEKVTGAAQFTADLPARDALVGRILRSPVAHGEIVRLDASKALALEGVRSSPAPIAPIPMASCRSP